LDRKKDARLTHQLGHGADAHAVIAGDELARLGVDNGLEVLELALLKRLFGVDVGAKGVLVL
jgi:hypothetical protein